MMLRTAVLCLLILTANSTGVMGDDTVIRLSNESTDNKKVKARDLLADLTDQSVAGGVVEFGLSAWDGECFLGVRLENFSGNPGAAVARNNRNNAPGWLVTTMNRQHRIYKSVDGHLEWEVLMLVRPKSDTLMFSMEARGLEFFFQDSICELPGCYRPELIRNSYAVYHSARSGNSITIIESDTVYRSYGSGKAFHIYRPRAWDNDGDTVWCQLHIDTLKSFLSITIPGDFLDRASFPVVVDPTFGYSSDPATRVALTSSYAVLVNTYLASNGDEIIGYSAFCADLADDDATGKLIAYTVDGGLPDDRMAAPIALPAVSGALGQWYHTVTVSHFMTGGTEYCVAVGDYANGLCCYYDSGSGTGYSRSSSGLSDPWVSAGTGPQRFGVYATYVTGSGSQGLSRRRRLITGGAR